MSVKIRKGVFETNSSSMHSLTVIAGDRMGEYNFNTIDVDGEELIPVYPDEYGWNGDDLKTPLQKLSYIITMVQYKDSLIREDDIEDSRYFLWLSEMIKDYVGYGIAYQPSHDEYYKYGYIDHESVDILDEYWVDDKEEFQSNMRDIIFNEKYFIIIDNDNH